jgi:hypothetical protein
MNRSLVCLIAAIAIAAFVACKAKTVVKPDPETEAALQDCREKIKDREALRELLEKEIAQLKLGQGGDETVLVQIQGNLLTVRAGQGSGPHRGEPKGDAKDEHLYDEFVKAVKGSHGAIKTCYQNALKKNNALQARTVSLAITVNFKSSGTMSSASFNPRISEHFDDCLRGIAERWKLPAAPRQVAFQYKISLTPE